MENVNSLINHTGVDVDKDNPDKIIDNQVVFNSGTGYLYIDAETLDKDGVKLKRIQVKTPADDYFKDEKLIVGNTIIDQTGLVQANTVKSTIYMQGEECEATGKNSSAFGYNTKAVGDGAHAEGWYTLASGNQSHAEGRGTIDSEKGIDKQNLASGLASHTEGIANTAQGSASHTEGSNNTASGASSHAEGNYTEASGAKSHAEGEGTKTYGCDSHSEGYGSQVVYVEYSDLENETPILKNDLNNTVTTSTTPPDGEDEQWLKGAHAEGWQTVAGRKHAHAEGNQTAAIGMGSHAEGGHTRALHKYSHASGRNTITGRSNQTVIGQWNKISEDALFVVGNGDEIWEKDESGEDVYKETIRQNAFVVDASGNAEFAGTIKSNNLIINGIEVKPANYADKNSAKIVLGNKDNKVHANNGIAIGEQVQTYNPYAFAHGRSTVAYGQYSETGGFGSTTGTNLQAILVDIDKNSIEIDKYGEITSITATFKTEDGDNGFIKRKSFYPTDIYINDKTDNFSSSLVYSIAILKLGYTYDNSTYKPIKTIIGYGTIINSLKDEAAEFISSFNFVPIKGTDNNFNNDSAYILNENYKEKLYMVNLTDINVIPKKNEEPYIVNLNTFIPPNLENLNLNPAWPKFGLRYGIFEGNYSISLGKSINVLGNYSLGIGYENIISGEATTVFGRNNISNTSAQTVIGEWNKPSNSLFVVGNGKKSKDGRSNAFEITQDGTAIIQKQIKIGNTVLTEKQLQDLLSSLSTTVEE